MRCIPATLLLLVLACSAGYGQTTITAQPPNTPATTNDSSSRQVKPPMAPMPPDSPMPDESTLPSASDKKQSAAKRKLEQLAPNCLDVFFLFHTCWSSPPAPNPKPPAKVDPEFTKDMDVGDFYLKERKNYAGAAMRFRDALERKPNDPAATFKLAQSLEGLHQSDEARQQYETYLKLEPGGSFAQQAKKALERMQLKGASATAAKPK